jgi:phage tail sheath protein FI
VAYSSKNRCKWRSKFDTFYAAAYYPWLQLLNFDRTQDRLIEIPPSAVAAGIIAAKELRFNIAWGPANEIAREIIKPSEKISPSDHDLFHIQGINVYTQERDGVLLTGARTLSTDILWRQLSVRRVILMIKRTLAREMQAMVFEPNTPSLRREITHMVSGLLRRLYRLGAFKGASETEAFFVRCDDTLNPPYRVDNGQLVVEIGVAPSEPVEFIVLQINRTGDGTLVMEAGING